MSFRARSKLKSVVSANVTLYTGKRKCQEMPSARGITDHFVIIVTQAACIVIDR